MMTVALSRLNFRDLGGIATADGATLRPHLIYRSEGPASFLDDHRAELLDLNIRTVCDLRSAGERHEAPNDWCGPDCRVLALDMNTDLRAQGKDIWDSLRANPSAANAAAVMTENYRLMPQALVSHMSMMVDALIDGEVPIMIHCTAGKDRTGAAIAILLTFLGVPRDAILADYAKSDVFGENMRIAGSIEKGFLDSFGFVPEPAVVNMMIGTEQDFLLASLNQIEAGWGTVEAYFEACGIGAERQAELRTVLLQA